MKLWDYKVNEVAELNEADIAYLEKDVGIDSFLPPYPSAKALYFVLRNEGASWHGAIRLTIVTFAPGEASVRR